MSTRAKSEVEGSYRMEVLRDAVASDKRLRAFRYPLRGGRWVGSKFRDQWRERKM